jgi:hypothetical protein
MSRRESFREQLSRLEQMAEDDGDTWDLSENDQAAIRAVLVERDTLCRALIALVTEMRDWDQAQPSEVWADRLAAILAEYQQLAS